MSNADIGTVYSKSVTHLGRGKGIARVDFQSPNGELHRFFVPYSFPHSPDGPKLSFQWDEFEYEGDSEYTSLPGMVKKEVQEMSEDARRKANY